MSFNDLVVGGLLRRSAVARKQEVMGGSLPGISFSMMWHDEADSAVGTLRLMLGGVVIWGDETDGLRCDWSRFLEHLAGIWNALRLEQGYPAGWVTAKPSAYARRVEAGNRSAHEFLARHNLAAWSVSESTPAFYVLREGNLAALECGSEFAVQPIADVLRSLKALGDAITERLYEGGGHPSADAWRRRGDMERAQALGWALNRPADDIQELIDSGAIEWASADQLARDLDEVNAAARMMGPRVRVPAIAGVARSIRGFTAKETPGLDALSVGALATLRQERDKEPHVQGHAVATWLRQKLASGEGVRFDIERLLQEWGVPVVRSDLPENIAAVAFWGQRHGPGILVGEDSLGHPARRRATLAHEACHLLVDRGSTLTVADVHGGCVPKMPEQRANAFGAELLLPRLTAIMQYRRLPDLDTTLDQLVHAFDVSLTLAGWQLLNYEKGYGQALSEKDRRRLQLICGESALP